ncbi:DNA replication/repair protein RecF [uncultured Amnibacterium sp.]|uniref:DNA replication/repair protein RecF n=1 Tax=uncultured Amnibacterium sp. TaxID=1631851 RepID=UPI0035CC70C9
MRILRLQLTDWRNYLAVEVAFVPGANVLTGSNGQGKTNLVEAIGYLSTLGSHRVAGDAPLIRAGADAAIIRAVAVTGDREVLAEVQINRSAPNRAQVNRAPVRARQLTREVSSVLFAPEDLTVVRGEPSARRRYLDELLVARTPRLAGVLSEYERALKQRNGLLRLARAGRSNLATLDIWDERLVTTGTAILEARSSLIADLAPLVAEQYGIVAGSDQLVAMRPVQSIDDAEPDAATGADPTAFDSATDSAPDSSTVAARFTAALAAVRRRELERGITLVGPHRDDLLLTINDLPARGYASHGESWSLALALRLGAVELLREASDAGDPIVILDDVFAELDERRRSRLAERVARYEQVIITAAVEADIPDAIRGAVTRVRNGVIEAAP